MGEAVIVGIIAAVASIIAAVVTSKATQNKVQEDLRVAISVQNVKIEHLTAEQKELKVEVRKHNGFAERVPVLEEKYKMADNRIALLEKKVG